MPNLKLRVSLLMASILISLLAGGLLVNPVAAAVEPTAEDAQQAITAAQSALNTAFGEVAQADLARAPTSDLVAGLNVAIATLDQARSAFNASDYASAVALAGNAKAAADTIRDQAQSRRLEANLQGAIQVLIVVAGVAIGLVVVYVLVTRWRRYQRQRRRDLLRMEIRLPKQQGEGEKHHE